MCVCVCVCVCVYVCVCDSETARERGERETARGCLVDATVSERALPSIPFAPSPFSLSPPHCLPLAYLFTRGGSFPVPPCATGSTASEGEKEEIGRARIGSEPRRWHRRRAGAA